MQLFFIGLLCQKPNITNLSGKKNQRKAYLFALLAVLFWSTISSAFKITLQYLSYVDLLFWSVLNGIVILFALTVYQGKIGFLKKVKKEAWYRSALMGFLNPFLYYLVLVKAYELLEAQVAGILNYIWPVVLVLLSIPILKQKIKPKAIVAIFISFFGIILISTQGTPLTFQIKNPLGVGLAVSSAVFWTLYWLINMKDKREATEKILLNTLFGLVYLILFMIFTHAPFQWPSVKGYLGTLYIGFFELSITFVIWLNALNYSEDTAKVSNLIYLSPFLALFWIHHAVGETIHWYTFAGLIFIIGGILLQSLSKTELPEKG